MVVQRVNLGKIGRNLAPPADEAGPEAEATCSLADMGVSNPCSPTIMHWFLGICHYKPPIFGYRHGLRTPIWAPVNVRKTADRTTCPQVQLGAGDIGWHWRRIFFVGIGWIPKIDVLNAREVGLWRCDVGSWFLFLHALSPSIRCIRTTTKNSTKN